MPVLTALLKSPEARDRAHTANLLGQMGPAAKSAVPALRAARADGDPTVRASVAVALGKIAP